jgi:hypothetical protein
VINWVELTQQPDLDVTLARLEPELRRALDCPDALRLPEPNPQQVREILDRARERLAAVRRRAVFP